MKEPQTESKDNTESDTLTHTEAHWSVGVVVGVVEKRGEGEEAALLTLISQSRKDFCRIFARVLHVVGFGKSFPNTFCTFCELLLFLMWRACVITFVFAFLPLCSFAAAFGTQTHSLSHTRTLIHSHTQDATQRANCVIAKVVHKNKNVSFVKFTLLLFLILFLCAICKWNSW